jgi:catechol 2,3-dioxygenase-like lactoylglutathione lyase family enzyme
VDQRLSLITLGVRDLERARSFYEVGRVLGRLHRPPRAPAGVAHNPRWTVTDDGATRLG